MFLWFSGNWGRLDGAKTSTLKTLGGLLVRIWYFIEVWVGHGHSALGN